MKSTRNEKPKRGRPPTGGTPVMVRIGPEQLADLDSWIEKQRDHRSRPDAIRQLLEQALTRPVSLKAVPADGPKMKRPKSLP
jgi:hypothetical protein